jgi:periplasmic divalent cation tolerance protein
MSQFIEIHWSSGSLDEARKVSRYLVQERFVACAQIIPWIESVYMWNNQLESAQESRIILKTRLDLYEAVKKIIKENCSYEIPEITFVHIDGGNQEYLEWLDQSLPVKESSEFTTH